MAPRKQISQQTFDECVAENVEDFGLSPAEAVADAVQQFESQGVDLSNIIKDGSAAKATPLDGAEPQEPLPVRIQRLITELKDGQDEDAVLLRLEELRAVCEAMPEARVVAGRNDAVDTLLALLEPARGVAAPASALLALLCADNADNQDFMGSAGMQRLATLLQRGEKQPVELTVALLALVKAACVKHESNKAHFTKAGGADALCGFLTSATTHESLSKHLALALRVVTIHDDKRATFSQAQETVKTLVAHDVIAYTLHVLRSEACADLLASWLGVLKQLATTEDNCQQIAELDGLAAVQRVMQTHEGNAAVTKRCIMVLRNVAAADDLKRVILQSGGVTRTLQAMQRHEGDAAIQQHACATLAAIALRSPDNSQQLVDFGAGRRLTAAMQTHRQDVAVLRQASLAVRNLAARRVEIRARLLQDEPDLEPLLREAQRYRGCGDEAYAALRDLGCAIQLSSFGAAAATAAASGSAKAPSLQPRFNPVQVPSNQLLDSVHEAAEPPFASGRA